MSFYNGDEFVCDVNISLNYNDLEEALDQDLSFFQQNFDNQNKEQKYLDKNTQQQQKLADSQNPSNMGSNQLEFQQNNVKPLLLDQQNQVQQVNQVFTQVQNQKGNYDASIDQLGDSNQNQLSDYDGQYFELSQVKDIEVVSEPLQIQEDLKKIFSENYQISKLFQECQSELYKKHYTISSFLKRGGFGAVFKGYHTIDKTEVAIKFTFPINDYSQEQTKQLFEDMKYERNIIDEIKCYQYIVKTIDLFIIQKCNTIIQIMEYCETDLYDYIQKREKEKNPLQKEEILDIYLQLINALVEIHVNNIVHLDIKPQNILRNSEGIYKLTDFGISQLLRQVDSSCTEKFKGLSQKYCSPEQQYLWQKQDIKSSSKDNLNHEQKFQTVSTASDVFSMGLTFLYILQLGLSDQTAEQIRNGKYEFDIKVQDNKNISTFIRYYMLSQNPKNRYSSLQLKLKLTYYFPNESQLFAKDYLRDRLLIEQLKQSKYNYKYISSLYLSNYSAKKSIIKYYFSNKTQSKENNYQAPKYIGSQNSQFQINSFIPLSLSYLGYYYTSVSKYQKSLEFFDKVLKIREALYQGNHQDVAQSLQCLSVLYSRLGNDQKALEYNLKALSMSEALYQGNHPDIALYISQSGDAYSRLHNHQKALEYNLKALSMSKTLYQENHPDIARSLLQLGDSYSSLGNYQKAIEYKLKALTMRQALYQGNHPDIAESHQQLGVSYQKLGNDQKALEFLNKALSMFEVFYQGNHLNIARTLSLLSYSYESLGKYQKALEQNQKALTMRQALYQGNHSDVASSLLQLSRSYANLNEFKKAIEFYNKALSMREALYQGNHPEIAECLLYFGTFQIKLGNNQKAVEYNLKALSMLKELFSGNHPNVAQSLSQLGASYERLGDGQKAVEYQLQALSMREALYQGKHPDIAESLSQLGVSYQRLGNDQIALEFFNKALKMREELYQGNHPIIAESLSQLGVSYQRLGNDQKAQKYKQKTMSMREALYKQNHPDVALPLSQQGVLVQRPDENLLEFIKNVREANYEENRLIFLVSGNQFVQLMLMMMKMQESMV